MRQTLVLLMLVPLAGCLPVVHSVHAIQPSQAVDTPAVWVEIKTDDEKMNGIYRCSDNDKEPPVCRKATLVR
jgi:2-phospho-L-lactate guanylyltransferase (CobY/MobA/RfbA family)